MCDPFIGGRLTKRKGCLLPPSWLDHHERKPFLDSHTFPLEPFTQLCCFYGTLDVPSLEILYVHLGHICCLKKHISLALYQHRFSWVISGVGCGVFSERPARWVLLSSQAIATAHLNCFPAFQLTDIYALEHVFHCGYLNPIKSWIFFPISGHTCLFTKANLPPDRIANFSQKYH